MQIDSTNTAFANEAGICDSLIGACGAMCYKTGQRGKYTKSIVMC